VQREPGPALGRSCRSPEGLGRAGDHRHHHGRHLLRRLHPNESGGISCFYSVLICFFAYRSLTAKNFKAALLEGARISAMIMMIIIGANLTQQVILMTQIPQNVLTWVTSLDVGPWVIIFAIVMFLFALGMPLEAVSVLVITLPGALPARHGAGFSVCGSPFSWLSTWKWRSFLPRGAEPVHSAESCQGVGGGRSPAG